MDEFFDHMGSGTLTAMTRPWLFLNALEIVNNTPTGKLVLRFSAGGHTTWRNAASDGGFSDIRRETEVRTQILLIYPL